MQIVETIKEYIRQFTDYISNLYTSVPNLRAYIVIGVAFVLVIGIFCVFFPSIREAVKRYDAVLVKRDIDFKKAKHTRYVSDHFSNRFARWLDDVYKYSRVYTKGKSKTSWQYFQRTLYLGFFSGILLGLFVNIPFGSLVMLSFWLVRYGYLIVLRMKNNKEVESEMVLFLNMLNNYSNGNTEIISVFASIAPRFKPILRDCLIECVQEAQGTSSWEALSNLGRKIESRKFNEVIKSLEISQRFSGGFCQTVQALRQDSQAYVNEKKKLTELVKENLITLGVIVMALLLIISVMGGMLDDQNIWIHFTEPLGIAMLGLFVGVVGWFLAQLVKINR